MADQPTDEKTKAAQPFDAALDAQIEEFLREIEKAGAPIIDREGKKKWVRGMIGKGYSLKLLQQKLKEYNYDFGSAGKYFDELAAGKEKAEKATKEVAKVQEERKEEKKKQKLGSRIGLILTAYILGGVGFFTWSMLKKTTKGIGEIDLMSGPAGGLMAGISKGSIIVGIAGVAVGTLLVAFVVADYYMQKAKEKKAKEQEAIPEGKKTSEVKMQEMEQELANAEATSKQKLEPPKLAQGQKPEPAKQGAEQKVAPPKLVS